MDIAGFHCLPVKFDETCRASHVVYIRKHSSRVESSLTPSERTLFAVNIPPYCSEDVARRLFSQYGPISAVYLRDKPGVITERDQPCAPSAYFRQAPSYTGFQCAYIVFEDGSSVERATSHQPAEPFVLSTESHPILTGMAKWRHDYHSQFPDPLALQKEVDEFMANYDERIKKEKEAARIAASEPDEEGWVTVTRGSKKSIATTTLERQQLTAQQRRQEKKKRKEAELLNFYQFQKHETQREHIAELRRKFEDDKSKIAAMRSARKFRPY